jgi:hypothetical protein
MRVRGRFAHFCSSGYDVGIQGGTRIENTKGFIRAGARCVRVQWPRALVPKIVPTVLSRLGAGVHVASWGVAWDRVSTSRLIFTEPEPAAMCGDGERESAVSGGSHASGARCCKRAKEKRATQPSLMYRNAVRMQCEVELHENASSMRADAAARGIAVDAMLYPEETPAEWCSADGRTGEHRFVLWTPHLGPVRTSRASRRVSVNSSWLSSGRGPGYSGVISLDCSSPDRHDGGPIASTLMLDDRG